MKKKILLALTLIAVFVCLLVITASAASQSYTTFDVTLTDGTTKTAYSAGTDQHEGRIYINAKLYAEAPLDSEGTYQEIDWATVKVIDFSNSMIYLFDNGTWTEMAYGKNQSNTAMYIYKNGVTSDMMSNLEKVITGKVKTIGGAFSNLAKLKEVVISKDAINIQYNAFDGNKLLTTVTFEDGSNLTTIGQQAFKNCIALTAITLPNTVNSMGGNVFDGCSSLTTINWPTSMTTIPSGTFNGCTALASFEIPSNITKIGGSAFKNCDSLVSITIPDSVTTIEGSAISYCDKLEEIIITDNSLISNKLVGFAEYSPKLKSIRIPPLVTEIGYDNFRGCTSLTEVIWPNNLLSISSSQNFNFTGLTKVSLPNSLTFLAAGTFGGSPIEEIRFGTGLSNTGNGNLMFKTLKRVYLPAEIQIGEYILGYSSSSDSSQNITFIFTGTKAQAEALQKSYEEWTLENKPGHVPNSSKFYDAELVSAKDYDVTQEPVGFHLVYDYSQCVAFYNGVHGNTVTTYDFEGADYFTAYQSYTGCDRCTDKDVVDIANALFTYKGFSTDGNSIVYDIRINKDAIEKYNAATGREIKYGIVASQIFNDGALLDNEGVILDNRVVAAEFSGSEYSILQIKILNVAENLKTTPIHCCAYVVDNSKVKYLYDTKDAEGKAVPNAFDVANQVTYAQANGQ